MTTFATSSAVTSRPMETEAPSRRSISGTVTPARAARSARFSGVFSVTVMPGWTTVTLIPSLPSSSARFLVIADTATFRTVPVIAPLDLAASPLTLTIRPQPAARMCGTKARMHRRYPSTFTLICSPNSSASNPSTPTTAPEFALAAAFTRMSAPPSPSMTAAAIAATDASSAVSQGTASTVRPESAARDSRAASSAALSRATSATSQPSATRARATASPIPRFPPVTTARFPLS